MHYHCEIVIPPSVDIEKSIASVMAPFDENQEEDLRHVFWDWYVIGGRWSGNKLISRVDKSKLDEFNAWLQSENVTVSGFQTGKPELSPPDQIDKIDSKWRELFPETTLKCPLFAHYNDQYASNLTLIGDIMRLGDVHPDLVCERVIIAGPRFEMTTEDWTGECQAMFMLCQRQWNGVTHMEVSWDGKLLSALDQWRDSLKNYREGYAEKVNPQNDWLVVTVDYHS